MSLPSIILAIATIVSGCAAAAPVNPGAGVDNPGTRDAGRIASRVVELPLDASIEYGELTLVWLRIADSRCPIGITCVWAGQMLASVEVEHSSRGKIELELLRRAAREPEVSHAFGYELRLLDVLPHPKKNLTPARGSYLMRVEITRP